MKKTSKTTSQSAARKLALRREAIVHLAPAKLADVEGGQLDRGSVLNGCTPFAPGGPVG